MTELNLQIGAAATRKMNRDREFSITPIQLVATRLNLTIKTVKQRFYDGNYLVDQLFDLVNFFQDFDFTNYIHSRVEAEMNHGKQSRLNETKS